MYYKRQIQYIFYPVSNFRMTYSRLLLLERVAGRRVSGTWLWRSGWFRWGPGGRPDTAAWPACYSRPLNLASTLWCKTTGTSHLSKDYFLLLLKDKIKIKIFISPAAIEALYISVTGSAFYTEIHNCIHVLGFFFLFFFRGGDGMLFSC